MTLKAQNTPVQPLIGRDDFLATLRERLREAVHMTLVAVLEEEVERFIGAERCERTPWRWDHRNGYYTRNLVTGLGLINALLVPRTRKGFQP